MNVKTMPETIALEAAAVNMKQIAGNNYVSKNVLAAIANLKDGSVDAATLSAAQDIERMATEYNMELYQDYGAGGGVSDIKAASDVMADASLDFLAAVKKAAGQ